MNTEEYIIEMVSSNIREDKYMSNITVSIIIPVYNCEAYLEQCIDSVLQQTIKGIEIICVDDGSTDKSFAVLQDYAKRYEGIHIYSQENSGAGVARNLGLLHASGEYVAFLDADDFYLDHDALEKMYHACKQKKISVCGSYGKIFEGDRYRDANFYNTENMSVENIYNYIDYQFDYGYTTFIFERDLLIEHSIKFPPYRRYQDPPFVVKAMYYARQFVMADVDLYCYRVAYSSVRYNQEKVIDLLKGIRDNLQFSMANKLDILFTKTLQRLEYESAYIILANISKELSDKNCEMMRLLLQLNDIARSYYKEEHYILRILQLLMMKAGGYTENYEKILLDKIKSADKIAIYGAGKYAKQFLNFLQNENMLHKIENIIVSKLDGTQQALQEIPIVDIDTFVSKKSIADVFVAVGAMHHSTIEQALLSNGVEHYELLDDAFLGSI